MFDLYPVSESSARRGWSFAGSLIIQVIGIAGLVLLPLFNTYEINPGDWLATAFSLAAPPPPAPAPQLVDPSPRPETVRYEADLRSPVAIPDRVALLHDNVMPVSPLGGISVLQGLSGGRGVSGSVGVVGMVLHGGQYLPLPPPIRVGGRIQSARMTHKVQPTYPQDAIEQNVTGTVKLEAIITTNGSVRDVKLINGHPLLAAAAIKAVEQWVYQPTLLNGEKVEVVTLIDIHFNLTIIDEKELKKIQKQQRRTQKTP